MAKIPHRLYLTEDQMPKQWYNLRADMKEKPDPLIHPGTHQPLPEEALYPIFCQKLAHQELDNDTRYIDIPEPVLDMYKLYRPSPLCRAYNLEKALDTPAKIYYKFEGNNTSGSHKLNSAIAQAYYAKEQGLKGLTTETGAGQWGTALSEACAYFGLDLKVFMVKVSYEQKPFRKAIMQTFDANVTRSPSNTTEAGRAILAHDPTTGGSLGCAISEAVEVATTHEGYRYVLGSVLNQVLLHQSVIGLETKTALDKYGIVPDIIIGCAGGVDTLAMFRYKTEAAPEGHVFFRVRVSDLSGGHSGDDIDKGRMNSNKLVARLLWNGAQRFGLRLSRFDGGNLRNAIPREAYAVFAVPSGSKAGFEAFYKEFAGELAAEAKFR